MNLNTKIKKVLRYGSLSVNILVAIATLLAAYGGAVNPEKTAIPAIFAMTFPFWLFTTVVLAIADLLTLKKLAIIPAVSLLASLGPVYAISPLNIPAKPSAKEKEKSFTVMSYNVFDLIDTTQNDAKKERGTKELRERYARMDSGECNPTIGYILSRKPDVLFVQEFPGNRMNPSVMFTWQQVDSLNHMLPHYVNHFGEDIFSIYGLVPVELRQPSSIFARFGAARAKIHGHETLLVCVHLQSIGLDTEDKELYRQITSGDDVHRDDIKEVRSRLLGKLAHAFRERAQQAKLLREQIDSLGIENVIIAGDFNDIPDCYALRTLCGNDFKNAFSVAGCGPTVTYHANRFYFHIDHIIYRGRMRPISFRRLKAPYSDHYPIETTFVWTD